MPAASGKAQLAKSRPLHCHMNLPRRQSSLKLSNSCRRVRDMPLVIGSEAPRASPSDTEALSSCLSSDNRAAPSLG